MRSRPGPHTLRRTGGASLTGGILHILVTEAIDRRLVPLDMGNEDVEQGNAVAEVLVGHAHRRVVRVRDLLAKQIGQGTNLAENRGFHCGVAPQLVADLLRRLPVDPGDRGFEHV